MDDLTIVCEDRRGEAEFSARLRWDVGENFGVDAEYIKYIWDKVKGFDVLFYNEIGGRLDPVFYTLTAPNSTWYEVKRDGEPVGIAYITGVVPGFDAEVGFLFWDRMVSGRQPLLLHLLEQVMDRFYLPRVSTKVPPYQSGTLRFVSSMGFQKEGEMRKAAVYKGQRWPLLLFGLTNEDLDRSMRGLYVAKSEAA